jgi:predicted porin
MNKKLLAAAVAAAVVAAPAAFAESTVYGKFHTSVDMVDQETAGASTTDNFQVNGRASRLGFKGSEDLGNGLKAIYQVEFGIGTDGGTGQANTYNPGGSRTPINNHRNTFVGLAGGWGTFLVGRHDTPAKMAFYAQGNERLGDSIIDLNSGGPLGVFTEVRASNGIAYVTPNFAGFTVAAAVVPGEEGVTATGNEADGLADHYSLGVMWKGAGLKAGLGYERLDDQAFGAPASGADDDHKMLQAGLSYTFGAFKVGGSYESTDNFAGVKDNELTSYALTGKATFGNNAVSLVYIDSEIEAAGGGKVRDKDGWGVAGEHNFSKRTKVYAAYATSEDDATNSDDDRFSLGMIHSF